MDGIFAACGCPADKFRAACAEVDKLDKLEWDEGDTNVRCGMLAKGLSEECVDMIGQYVRRSGLQDLVKVTLMKIHFTSEILKGTSERNFWMMKNCARKSLPRKD